MIKRIYLKILSLFTFILAFPDASILRGQKVVTIPVVVHIVWRDAVENISDAQIQSQLKVLNEDFREKNPDFLNIVPPNFQNLAADCELEFCLAQRDTLGNLTTGITRRQTTVNNIGTSFQNNRRRIYYQNLGGTNNWKPTDYLNIWVCKMDLNTGLGFTTSLEEALLKPAEDGILVDYRHFGTIGTAATTQGHTKGRTATHEIGHYFNLLHIWGNKNDCSDDDEVSDTPQQAEAFLGCPDFREKSCVNLNAMHQNFMDYTNDECMGIFTQGQKARIWACLNTARKGLLESRGCLMVSLQELDNQLFIKPNPTSDFFSVSLAESKNLNFQKPTYVQLFDLSGRLLSQQVFSTNDTDAILIDVQEIPNGLYFILMKNGSRFWRKKVVVLR